MLHLRRSTLLKQLFHTNLQRPVAASRNKSLKSHNCSAAASFDANTVSTLKVLGRHAYTARAPRPFLSSGASWSGGASWSARSYCVKSKDALTSDEPGKKDDVPSGPTGDECGFKLICFVGINVCLRGGLHAMWLFGLEFICDRQLIPGRRVAMRILRYVLRLALKTTGLRTGDPRLKECIATLKETLKNTSDGIMLDRHLFKKLGTEFTNICM
ncbi:unnamed protein product [Boreogadus saida]